MSLCGAAFAQAEDSRPQLQDRLIAVATAQGYGTEGSQFGLDQGVPEGKSVRYAFALKAGETYFVAGGCDKNCTSLALLMTDANSAGVAYTEDGEIVAHTPFDGTVHPSFTITAAKTTTYSIVINVAGCHRPQSICVAGAAVFHAGSKPDAGWIRTDDFTIDLEGTIVLSDDFSDEMFCVIDTIDNVTADAAAKALANNDWPADIDAKFKAAVSTCADDYDWSDSELNPGLVVSTTQVLLNFALDQIQDTDVDYDDIVEIQNGLSDYESAEFRSGEWVKDVALIAKLDTELKTHGIGEDSSDLTMANTAIGAYANQSATVRSWGVLLRPK
ncbi:MAG: hypothetical protein ABMA14_19020 [Hyphomonadaceae bacterium]